MPTTTTHYGFIKPDRGQRQWDTPLNQDMDLIDAAIANVQSGISTSAVTSLSVSGISVFLRGDVHLQAGPGATINFRTNTNTIEISGIGSAGGTGEAVSSLGIFGDGTTLTDEVKLRGGPGITLTRDSANNAILISGTQIGSRVTTLSVTGGTLLAGDVSLTAGPNITLTRNGQAIEVSGISSGSSVAGVSSYGILGDGTSLTGAVKVSAGPGIALTRDSGNNAILISGTQIGSKVTTLSVTGGTLLAGDVSLTAGSNVTLTRNGQAIEVSGIHVPDVSSISNSGVTQTFTGAIKFIAGPGQIINFAPATNSILFSGTQLSLPVVSTYVNGASTNISRGDAVFISSTNTVKLGNATLLASGLIIGLVAEAGPVSPSSNVLVAPIGLLASAGSGFTAGQRVFLSTTGTTFNTLTQTAPTGSGNVVVKVGVAKNSTDVEISIAEPIEI